MKKSLFLFSILFFFFVCGINAQQQTNSTSSTEENSVQEVESEEEKKEKKSRGESQDNPEHWPTIKELVAGQFNFGVMHNWGATWASITRIQKQEDVSNFVWTDRMLGAFYEVTSNNFRKYNDFWSMNFVGRMAVYYPYRYRFRDVPQHTTQTLLYNFDWFLAPKLTYSLFDRVRFDFGLGLHMAYQIHDMFHFFNMGIGAKIDAELPISPRWTLLMGGMFSWDNGNLGNNGVRYGNIRHFDYVYEYQIQFGARYSKKYLNPYSYIKYKPKPLKTKKVRKLDTYSEDLDLELDIPQEVLDEIEAEANKNKEEPPVAEEPVVEEQPVQQEEVEADAENAEPKVKEKKQKEKKVKEPKEPKEPKVKEPKEPKEPKVKEPKPPKEPKQKKEKQKKSKETETAEEVLEEAAPEVEPEPASEIPAGAIRR